MKRILSMLMLVFMLMSLMTTPAFASTTDSKSNTTATATSSTTNNKASATASATGQKVATSDTATKTVDDSKYINGEITLTRHNERAGKSFNTYSNQEAADRNPITVYVSDNSAFPIEVKMQQSGYSVVKCSKIESYGTHRRILSSVLGAKRVFATIIVKQQESEPYTYRPKEPTQEEILDQNWKTLLSEIGFPFYYAEYNAYAKEVKAFLSGEWDGSEKRNNDRGSCYNATRYVMGRTYHWIACNMITGESYDLSANVDYIGHKEVIPGPTNSQDYSLAVSRRNGEIEQWSLLGLKDSWKITQVTNGQETIDDIIPIGNKGSSKNDAIVFVSTTSLDGDQHFYSLMPNGKVNRTM